MHESKCSRHTGQPSQSITSFWNRAKCSPVTYIVKLQREQPDQAPCRLAMKGEFHSSPQPEHLICMSPRESPGPIPYHTFSESLFLSPHLSLCIFFVHHCHSVNQSLTLTWSPADRRADFLCAVVAAKQMVMGTFHSNRSLWYKTAA